MFKGGQPNPYDDIVNKTTDENLTSENWELILNLCDKVQDEGPDGARNVIAAVLKRLAHRNPNVQLYALSLAEALSKNCTIDLHREIASRAFTQGLEKIITDRTTHEKVKRRALGLIALWTSAFENDSTLGIMEDCYTNLKSKNYKFEAPEEPAPPVVDDEVRRREEEELQRVLEMSMQDKGGRNQWQGYSPAAAAGSSSAAGGSGSGSQLARRASASASSSIAAATASGPKLSHTTLTYNAGYSPARSASLKVQTATTTTTHMAEPTAQTTPASARSSSVSVSSHASNTQVVTRVRALHTFEPTEPGELAFEKGEIIKVVDRGYKDWWRGQLKGRTGIFPVNYVEPMPEPTAAELANEAEKEAVVFAQAANVDRLLTMLRSLDPAKDNLADNEEIQELYRSSMALRPKIVKLIDKYSQKRADLVSMNETFVRARTIFDRMMEESLARHTGVYESQSTYRPPQYQGRPDSRARARPEYATSPGPQAYGWTPVYDQPGYNSFPTATPAAGPNYAPGPDGPYPSPYADPAAYTPKQQQQAPYAPPYGVQQPGVPYGPQGPSPYSAQTQTQPELTPAPQLSPQQSLQAQHPPAQSPQDQQQQGQQAQASQQQAAVAGPAGPLYVYDPNGTYSDPNVQAWASYYAQGGKEVAGSIYFIAIPGVTDDSPQPGAALPHPQSLQPQPGAGQLVPSEHASFAGPQVQLKPQSQVPQTSQLGVSPNGYAAGVPAAQSAPHDSNPGAAPPLHASPPGSPGQPSSASSYQTRPGPSGGPPAAAQGAALGHPQQHSPQLAQQQQHAPPPQTYGQSGELAPGQAGSSASTMPRTQASREAAAPGPAQYHALSGQFAGMNASDGAGPGVHAGQHVYQAPQGVGAG
jgi:signal transducing adaptor molecule